MATINVEHMIPIFPTKDKPEENERLRILAMGSIKRHAEWMASSARQIHESILMLKTQPEWETQAEDAMLRARRALEEAIHNIDNEIIAFRALERE